MTTYAAGTHAMTNLSHLLAELRFERQCAALDARLSEAGRATLTRHLDAKIDAVFAQMEQRT